MDNIVWQKTSIGAQEPSHEFTAIAPNGIDVGRIYRIDGGPLKGRWRWVFLLGHSQFRQGMMSGDQASKATGRKRGAEDIRALSRNTGLRRRRSKPEPLKKQSNQDLAV